MKDNYVNIYKRTKLRTWLKEYEGYTKKSRINERYSSIPESEIDEKQRMYSEQYLSKVENFEIVIGIPLIVIGENNGFLDVKMKEEKVDDFIGIGYGVYLFSPNIISPSSAELMKGSSQFPVVIANLKSVECCLKDIEDGIDKMTRHAISALKANPLLIYSDVREFIQSEGLQSFANQ